MIVIPRPHPLTRRNGLVNQVESLGLAHAFVTLNLATFKTFCGQPAHKKDRHSNGDDQFFNVVRVVLRSNY